MGPFFYSKKEIPAKPEQLIKPNCFLFFLVIPPKATIFLLVK